MNLCFTYEFHDTLKSFNLVCFSLLKLSRNWIWNAAFNSEYKLKKIAVVIHVLHADNTEFSHFTLQGLWAGSCLFAEDGTEITKN